MRNFFILLFFNIVLFAENPTPFFALGDIIYNNVDKIEKLKEIDEYKIYSEKIEQYVQDVNRTKSEGFSLEFHPDKKKSKEYLKRLRELVKTNDFFVHSVENFYEEAKKKSNSRLFSQIINSGLLDTNEHKKEIIDYYFAHQEDMNTTGVIQSYLDADAKLKAKKEFQKKRTISKKKREEERIKRLREEDRRQKELLEKRLQEELKKKKEQIREYQKKELSKTI